MGKIINIHTHVHDASAEVEVIQADYSVVCNYPKYSVGIHPWKASASAEKDFYLLERVLSSDNNQSCVAIGECGLDKLKNQENGIYQESIFRSQLELAMKYKMPVILHAVQSNQRIAELLKAAQFDQPVIVHGIEYGFSKLEPLLEFNSWFSFGQSITRSASVAIETMKQLGMKRIFLETDDKPIPVASVYASAAQHFNVDLNSLSDQLENNYFHIFPK